MATSPPHPRFARRSQAWAADAPGCERIIARPESRGNSNCAAVRRCWVSPPWVAHVLEIAKSIVPVSAGRRFRNVIHRVGAQNAAMITWPPFCLSPTGDPVVCGDRTPFSRSGCRSRLHGWIPITVDGTSAPGAKNFPLLVSPASGDPDRHSSRMRLWRQNSWLRSGRSASLALRSLRRLRLCFVFPAIHG